MDTLAEPLPTEHPSVRVAVVLCRRPTGNRWQPFQWRLEAVVPDLGEFGAVPRCLDRTDAAERWLTPERSSCLVLPWRRKDVDGYRIRRG
ncbi:DUF3305 domain-containing protein, partial [Ralstonia pseudosolanacearum]|uniref:DUF3305 domain-containing protein n=1 Tax=Ralstonia pseudosolanacearum TaxID=1310165 RepID=UPI003D17DAF0